jgi:hypothetical protein
MLDNTGGTARVVSYSSNIAADFLEFYIYTDYATQAADRVADIGINGLPVMRVLGTNHTMKFQVKDATDEDVINVNTTAKYFDLPFGASARFYPDAYLTPKVVIDHTGIILKDTATGTFYRVTIANGIWDITPA